MDRYLVFVAAILVRRWSDWLLSSAAQSAAALVAIVGGFLASRVIALSTERDAAVRRLSDLYPKLEQARKRQQDVADELKSWDDWLKDAEMLRQTLGEQQLAQLRELSDQRAEVSYRVRDLESQVEQAERYVASLRAPEDIWKGVVVRSILLWSESSFRL